MQNIYGGILDSGDDKVDFSAIKLELAPPEKIRAWSYGEVRVPETINYRTFRPEEGGLFCSKIFGPMKDYECLCGKYKRIKYRGIVCEKCGVEVTLARVRRERMGHINLACPVAHILFFKALPSRIGLVLDLTMRDIERILYFEVYVVIDPQRVAELERGQILKIEEYQELQEKHPGGFRVGIGAEGVREFLKDINLGDEAKILRDDLERHAHSDSRRKKIFKRLKIIENFQQANLRPEWMVLETLPVLPPDLRPLVQLEGGRFTTSDLNDLYRRVINRNNRLQRLMDLDAPEVIINNEKRMLQEAVDSLLDNSRRGKPSVGSNRRPLKSLVDIIKGKSGRFRQNLLGKRVDFSGRSVIVVGPDLKLHQCGLPKQMALTLFRPFVFSKLMDQGYAASIKIARVMVESEDPNVWKILEEVIDQHPVLLNRAPTLHRLGVQAFEPVLIEGKAIQLHPLVCVAFNADFDGDQMAVHVPLSLEAQAEARVLMLASNNILAPANGDPVIVPTQDVVLGLYYATREQPNSPAAGMILSDLSEVERALFAGVITLQTPIQARIDIDMAEKTADEHESGAPQQVLVKTTAGRALLKRLLPANLPFAMINKTLKKRDIVNLIKESFRRCGHRDTVIFCDQLMRFGFEKATKAGVSVCMDDMIIPPEKSEIIRQTEQKIRETHEQFNAGLLTVDERYNKSVDYWDRAGEQVSSVMMKHISTEEAIDSNGKLIERESFNSIYMMADSGARGSETQIKQLAGMRGLITKPDGRIMENAITVNFREGLSVLQYFISTHGARKGLSDTALKTANSGYMTRRLVDVTQDIVISEDDCGCKEGITMRAVVKDGNEIVTLYARIVGRTLAKDVLHPQTRKVIYPAGTYLDDKEAEEIVEADVDEVDVRSPVTCHSSYGLCIKCYGRDLGRGGTVQMGEAVGVIAAQSIGEPGTQLTMRTFHIGGAASREVVAESVNARNNGVLRLSVGTRCVTNRMGDLIVVSRSGEMLIQEKSGRERERYRLQYGQVIKFKEGAAVKSGDILSQRDPMARPIVAEYAGQAMLENVEMGVNAREQTDDSTGVSVITITENKQSAKKAKTPQIKFLNKKGEEIKVLGTDISISIALTPGAILSAREGQAIHVGDILAKVPQKGAKSRDITGGLPRVAELFEAREPKEPAILASASGFVRLRGLQRAKQVLAIMEDNKKITYNIPAGVQVIAKDDSEVKQGEIIAHIKAPIGGEVSLKTSEDGGGTTLSVSDDNKIKEYLIPNEFRIFCEDGKQIEQGETIAELKAKIAGLLYIRGNEKLSVSGAVTQLAEICDSTTLPPAFAAWAKNVTSKLENCPDSPDKLIKLVGIAQNALTKVLRDIEKQDPHRKELVLNLKKWHSGFMQRARPDKWQSATKDLQQWAENTTQTLKEQKATVDKTPDYKAFYKTATDVAEQLAAFAKEKEHAKKLREWRKKIDEIEKEYQDMDVDKSDAKSLSVADAITQLTAICDSTTSPRATGKFDEFDREIYALPPEFKAWAQDVKNKLENCPDSPDRLIKLVGIAQNALTKVSRDIEKQDPHRKERVFNLKKWYNSLIQRAHPDKWQGAPEELQRWAEDTTQKLIEQKATVDKTPDYRVFHKTAINVAEQLAPFAEEKEHAKKLDGWRKRIGEIEKEYQDMGIDKGDAKSLSVANAQMQDIVDKMQVIADSVKASKLAGGKSDAKSLSVANAQIQGIVDKMQVIADSIKASKLAGGKSDVEIISASFHSVPKDRTILVQDGVQVNKGEEIVDGDVNPHEILAMRGVEALVQHIVGEVQDVYRLQGVSINDKHIEVIIHQMLRYVNIVKAGDSSLIPGDQVMRTTFIKENRKLLSEGKRRAQEKSVLLGITKASLATDSFISAASFQETSRVLTEAAVAGRRDHLRGLKENVIVGRLVPAGTGYVYYQKIKEDNRRIEEAESIMRAELEVKEEPIKEEADSAVAKDVPMMDS